MLKGQVNVQNKILQLNKQVVRVYDMLIIVLSKIEEKNKTMTLALKVFLVYGREKQVNTFDLMVTMIETFWKRISSDVTYSRTSQGWGIF